MTNALKIGTNVGFGFALQTDPFQSGREAAQIAKNSLGDFSPQLALAMGPANPQFQDFIEGVRLVTGENTLVGLPVQHVYSRESVTPGGCAVLLLSSNSQKITLAAEGGHDGNPLALATRLLTQIRLQRGSVKSQYEFHGLLTFQLGSSSPLEKDIAPLWNELPLENWFAGVRTLPSAKAPLVCHDKILTNGTALIDCLSNSPWGLSVVDAAAFNSLPNIFPEAAKTALRNAKNNLGENGASAGLVFLHFNEEEMSTSDLDALFKSAGEIVGDIPLLAFPADSSFLYSGEPNTFKPGSKSITVLLIPD